MSKEETSGAETLFLDDAEGLLTRIQSRLDDCGYRHAAVVSSVEGARDMLRNRMVGHVVCDWKMPDEDGIAFLSWVGEQYPAVRKTLLTGHVEDLAPEDCQRLAEANIQVCDKSEIDTSWLLNLVGADDLHALTEGRTLDPPMKRPERPDIGELKLEIEELRIANDQQRHMITQIAQDIVDDLRKIEDPGLQLVRGEKTFTVNDIIREIENQTPDGLRFIQLDRAVRRRLLHRDTR